MGSTVGRWPARPSWPNFAYRLEGVEASLSLMLQVGLTKKEKRIVFFQGLSIGMMIDWVLFFCQLDAKASSVKLLAFPHQLAGAKDGLRS